MRVKDEVSDVSESDRMSTYFEETDVFAQIPRIPGFDFPIFEGNDEDDPVIWVDSCAHYFHQCEVSEARKLGTAAIHLRGKAGAWYLENKSNFTNWEDLRKALCLKYETAQLRKKALCSLKQIGSVEQYQKEFMYMEATVQGRRYMLADDTPELVAWFIDGLKNEIGPFVGEFKPKTLCEAVKVAKLIESCQKSTTKWNKLLGKPWNWLEVLQLVLLCLLLVFVAT
ncbi:hypothetical protein Droror1_Dr00009475 [Drosera rotundifolia]